MKKNLSFLFLLSADIFVVFFAILAGVIVKNIYYDNELLIDLYRYISFILIYIIMIFLLTYHGVYTRRFDFWHESRIIVKSSFLALLLILAFLALANQKYEYSRSVFILSFIFMMIFLPMCKFFLKRLLFKVGLWRKEAKILGETSEFELDLFSNHYLGYVRAKGKNYESLFIGSGKLKREKLNELIEQNIRDNKEILFTPMLNTYDFTQAHIYTFFNSRTNVFAIQNSLQNTFTMILKRCLDVFLIVLFLPFWMLAFVIISIIIKIQEPKSSIFFSQARLGLNGKEFNCYKFRSMCINQDFMPQWLNDNPDEVLHYKIYKKYKNDPRITNIGKILRKTSLDELPQIINVLKGEMSLVGPRPYLLDERVDFDKYSDIILSVKPGITGLWQVSGRSDVDFIMRTQMDVWYMKNWSIWNDIVIIIKTIKVVLYRNGAS